MPGRYNRLYLLGRTDASPAPHHPTTQRTKASPQSPPLLHHPDPRIRIALLIHPHRTEHWWLCAACDGVVLKDTVAPNRRVRALLETRERYEGWARGAGTVVRRLRCGEDAGLLGREEELCVVCETEELLGGAGGVAEVGGKVRLMEGVAADGGLEKVPVIAGLNGVEVEGDVAGGDDGGVVVVELEAEVSDQSDGDEIDENGRKGGVKVWDEEPVDEPEGLEGVVLLG